MPKKQIANLRLQLSRINARSLSSRTLKPIAVELRSTIYNRIKSGFGVVSDRVAESTGKRLKLLAESTKAARRRRGVRGDRGTPNRSNLTDTGQLLDSLRSIARRGEIIIDIPDSRRRGSPSTNKQIAGFVRKERPFLALTRKEAKQLNRDVNAEIVKLIKRSIKG